VNIICRFFGHRWRWLSASFIPKPKGIDGSGNLMSAFGMGHVCDVATVTKLCTRCKEIDSHSLYGEITLDQLNGRKDAEIAEIERMAR
jgi:hypothetical protein